MNPKHSAPAPPTLGLNDVLYPIFRHKWLITGLVVLTLVAAAAMRFLWSWPYLSEAKLEIKYVTTRRAPTDPGNTDTIMTQPTGRDDTVINTEIQVLTSMDLATNVAQTIGPAKILAKKGKGNNLYDAAGLIESGLIIVPQGQTNRSDVIEIVFSHPDPELAQQILGELVTAYLAKHKAIHRPEFNGWIQEQIDRVRAEEDQTDRQLRDAKGKANIISVDDSKKEFEEEKASLRQKIDAAEEELAGYRESVNELERLMPALAPVVSTNNTNSAANNPDLVPAEKRADYQRVCNQYESQITTTENLRSIYTTNNPRRQVAEQELASITSQKKALEGAYPALLLLPSTSTQHGTGDTRIGPDPKQNLDDLLIKQAAATAQVRILTNRLAETETQGAVIIANEGGIKQLEAKKSDEEKQMSFYLEKLQEDPGNEIAGNSNIAIIEEPTPASHDLLKINKMIRSILGAGLAVAFGLPFLIELVLNRSLKNPLDVQSKLGLPFFVSIPLLNGSGKKVRAMLGGKNTPLLPAAASGPGETPPGEPPAGEPEPDAPVAPILATNGNGTYWDQRQDMLPYCETLRDRLMTYFEMINLTHKPKLVAVTSCREGAGVTTTAAGLASSLSETGDGNVLLVNMNVRDGQTHHFYKGKLACGLDQALEKETREGAFVEGNLYVAREHAEDDRLPRVLPKRFSHLLPKMKASDFDYIIFDMPPISQISITPRLARFMDMVLLVIESGKTDRDAAKRATDLLSESKTNVGIVLNKNRSYLPRSLQHDI